MNQSDPEEEQRFEALFAALEAPLEPTEAQRRRWRQTLVDQLAGRRRRRWYAAAAAVAASVAIGLVALSGPGPEATGPTVADVVAAFGGNVVREDGAVVRTLAAGDTVYAGERVESGLRSGLGLRYQGLDLRVDAQTRLRFEAGHLALLRGRVYVDAEPQALDPGPAAGPEPQRVSIRTPWGTVRHTGTQFVVAVGADRTVAAVREGGIVVSHRGRELRLQADGGEAVRISLQDGSEPRQSRVSAVGELWSWTLAVSPGLVLSGRSADEVLQWAAREQGQRLAYGDPDVARIAGQVLLGGSGSRFAADQALEVVAAAAPTLRIEARGAVLKVTREEPAAPADGAGPPPRTQ